MKRTGHHADRSSRGTVLIVVLIVIALLALGGYTFSQAMLGERTAAQANARRMQARAAADSGLAKVMQLLVLESSGQPIVGGTYNNPSVFQAQLVTEEDSSTDPVRFTFLAPDLAYGSSNGLRYGLEDESARLNLNLLVPLMEALSSSLASGGSAASGGGAGAASGNSSTNSNSSNTAGSAGSSSGSSGTGNTTDNTNSPTGDSSSTNESASTNSGSTANPEASAAITALSSANPTDVLLALPGMTEDVADAILDWLDADSEARAAGAEAEYYGRLNPPYGPKNGPLDSLDELLMVRGVTPQLLYGLDQDHDGVISAKERSLEQELGIDTSTGEMDFGWAGYLTLHSAEANLYQGQPRINLNADDLTQLSTDLQSVLTQEWVNFIIAYRQFGPAPPTSNSTDNSSNQSGDPSSGGNSSDNNSGDSTDGSNNGNGSNSGDSNNNNNSAANTPVSATEFTPDLSQPAKTKIGSVLDLIGVQVRTSAASGGATNQPAGSGTGGTTGAGTQFETGGGNGSSANAGNAANSNAPTLLLQSPFANDPGAMASYLPTLLDMTSPGAAAVVPGRININEAPAPVLNGIPGITPEIVDAILANRQSDASLNPTRLYPTWLLTEGFATLDQMKLLLPFVTGRGSVYRARVVGFSDVGGPTVRIEAVIDATTPLPRQLCWKELSYLGLGYPREILGGDLQQQTSMGQTR
jgi:hypothetical protein